MASPLSVQRLGREDPNFACDMIKSDLQNGLICNAVSSQNLGYTKRITKPKNNFCDIFTKTNIDFNSPKI